ncbi:hypothetical protein HIM_07908 [Hirsutella minnesotensis 3608]|uniref:37S ribosomal protein S25, mitochondrial n=1 Tax=Hirsutella minnesotensis 3608 TaxID=1043627 RepID=A0A0F7ZHI8_9HYPO|nr:hypothetical protein HIM_07908 [Hirsutella minnesotensis 3608]
MGGRQIRPAGVYKAITQELQNPLAMARGQAVAPPWWRAMEAVPPAETLVRNVARRHGESTRNFSGTKKLFKPKKIEYQEDALRSTFYQDHPWELARPRVILELDGKDHEYCDWSKGVQQLGIPLTGECVVQRQMWLMKHQKMSLRRAYDTARREFYRLRQLEEIEQRIAIEEARYVGAYFGKTKLEIGMLLEDKEFENWKIWAGKQTADQEARNKASLDTFDTEAETNDAEEVDTTAAGRALLEDQTA